MFLEGVVYMTVGKMNTEKDMEKKANKIKKIQEKENKKANKKETTKEVTGTLGEIPTPKVLRPNEIQTEFTDPVKVKKNIEKPSEEETETKQEVVEEENLKV